MTIMTEMAPSPTPALDYDSTLIMTVEVSDQKWMDWLSMRVRFGLFWWLVEVAWQR
jgi:hypothetical protein